MNYRVFDIAVASFSSRFKADGCVERVLLGAFVNLDGVKLSGSVANSSIEFHAVSREDVSTPLVATVMTNDLHISRKQAYFPSSVNTVEVVGGR